MRQNKISGMSQPVNQQRHSDQFFNRKYKRILDSHHKFNPVFNSTETEESIEVKFAITHLNRDNFDIALENDVLTISGRSRILNKDTNSNLQSEIASMPFTFSMVLPKGYKADQISAKFSDEEVHLDIPFEREPNETANTIAVN